MPSVDQSHSVPSPESFAVSADRRSIIRRVQTRGGSQIETSFVLQRALRRARPTQIDLCAMADAAYLQADLWPPSATEAATVRTVDLFSGCGAMSLGAWEAARALSRRLEPILAVDVNSAALGVYKRNFAGVRAISEPIEQLLDGSIGTQMSGAESALVQFLGKVDLLIGGPPCQGHSNLNNHTRRNDPKNHLYMKMARFAEVVRPEHIIIENVSAVLHDRSHVVDRTIDVLCRLGYNVDHGIIEVSEIGVAQKRRRHILMASMSVVPSLDCVALYSTAPRSVEWAIGDLIGREASSALDLASTASIDNKRRIAWLFKNDEYDLPDRLRPDCHKLKPHSYRSVYGRMHWDRPAQTITSGFTSTGQGRFVHPQEPRTITPHEAARIQFIPDFFDFGERTQRTALSEMIGNAVPSKLSYVLTLELLR